MQKEDSKARTKATSVLDIHEVCAQFAHDHGLKEDNKMILVEILEYLAEYYKSEQKKVDKTKK